ncbi:MAG TPA: FeoA family protein [Bacteroidia bacterium]|nr:FeoA family protein [Bacteroidia bacterium]
MRSLAEIQKGQKVRIISFKNADIANKLIEMGCLPGEIVMLTKTAPLGCPMAIEVAGYELSLRRQEAAQVNVEALD